MLDNLLPFDSSGATRDFVLSGVDIPFQSSIDAY